MPCPLAPVTVLPVMVSEPVETVMPSSPGLEMMLRSTVTAPVPSKKPMARITVSVIVFARMTVPSPAFLPQMWGPPVNVFCSMVGLEPSKTPIGPPLSITLARTVAVDPRLTMMELPRALVVEPSKATPVCSNARFSSVGAPLIATTSAGSPRKVSPEMLAVVSSRRMA